MLELYASPYICGGSKRRIDGAFFQALLSAISMGLVVCQWVDTTEADWPWNGYSNRTRYGASSSSPSVSVHQTMTIEPKSKSENALQSTTSSSTRSHQAVHIESMPGIPVEFGLSQLNNYREEFLNEVESEVRRLIRSSEKRDLTAVVANGMVYRGPPVHIDGWGRRLWAMIKHSWSSDNKLPTYNGEELDSWLTGKICEKVDEVHLNFLQSHSDICGKVMLQRLRDHPPAIEALVHQFAASAREAGKPITDEMCKGLIHVISSQMATQTADQLGQQLGHSLLHVGGSSVIATFTSSMAHAMTSAVTKLTLEAASKMTIKIAMKKGGSVLAHVVITTILGSVSTAAAAAFAKGSVASFLSMSMPYVILSIIAVIAVWEVSHFTSNLADKIGPKVRDIMSGEFEEKNRSALMAAGKDSLVAFGKDIGLKMAMDMDVVKHAEAAGKEIVKAKLYY